MLRHPAPFAPAADTCARMTVESNICTRCARSLKEASASKKVSNTPLRLKRQKRFQMLFQEPNSGKRIVTPAYRDLRKFA